MIILFLSITLAVIACTPGTLQSFVTLHADMSWQQSIAKWRRPATDLGGGNGADLRLTWVGGIRWRRPATDLGGGNGADLRLTWMRLPAARERMRMRARYVASHHAMCLDAGGRGWKGTGLLSSSV